MGGGGHRPGSATARSSAHQVAEDALEVVVERGDLEQLGVGGLGHAGDHVAEAGRPSVVSTTIESSAVELDADDRVGLDAGRWPRARARSVRMRTRCGRSSIRSRMARKSPSAARRPWTMTSTREPKRSTSSSTWLDTTTHRPSAPSCWNRSIMWQALAGVEAGERLVEHDHVGVVDDGLGHLDPLAHALGVGRASAGGRRGRARPRPGPGAAASAGSVEALEHRGQPHELEGASCARTRPPAGARARCGGPARRRGGGRRRGRAPCRATGGSARTASAAWSTCRRRWGRAAR